MVFCQVDQKLVDLILKLAAGRTVVDMGCGEGLLASKMKNEKIISVDISPSSYAFINNIIRMAARDFPFTSKHFMVALRPEWNIQEAVFKHIDAITDFLYVTRPKHVEGEDCIHFRKMFFDIEPLDWNNYQERAYHVRLNKDRIRENEDEYLRFLEKYEEYKWNDYNIFI